ncbi:hypothetical protein ElyMa_001428000 [Elysia marginata]|uniref:Uncharacterized protein n=1 Tax=Elysia marginata TaxID=1093978 RepID=A0AAV4IX74_9GAST|nr:hypothetical protein ElyMa_001428000 [Elysia marginata]
MSDRERIEKTEKKKHCDEEKEHIDRYTDLRGAVYSLTYAMAVLSTPGMTRQWWLPGDILSKMKTRGAPDIPEVEWSVVNFPLWWLYLPKTPHSGG